MFTYNALIKACNNLGLDPKKIGSNPLMKSHPLSTFEKPFDLGKINFPQRELLQVTGIGKIIFNLRSQSSFSRNYDSSRESKEARRRDIAIEKILPVVNESLDFWFQQGMEKCKSTKKLILHNGNVFEIDHGYQKSMDKMNKDLEEYRKDFIHKSKASLLSARDIILD